MQCPFELGPASALERPQDAVVYAPIAHEEIEVVGAREIAGLCGGCQGLFFRDGCWQSAEKE